MASDIRLQVAVPCPVRNYFTYLAPAQSAIQPGTWVEAPLGRRHVVGLVMAVDPEAEAPDQPFKLKPILGRLNHMPPLDTPMLDLITWSIRYYHATPWDVISAMVPVNLLNRRHAGERRWQLVTEPDVSTLRSAPRQQALAEWLQTQPPVTDAQIAAAGFSSALRRELAKRDLLQVVETRETPAPGRGGTERTVSLNTDQQRAASAVELNEQQTYVLQGPTGSGKTEVYLDIARRVIDAGQQVLLLVPEIGLAPQMEKRLCESLDARFAIFHSDTPDTERRDAWLNCASGNLDIVIGTRSAVFLPFRKLGLIVLDEEHDPSYKQQEGWRYHARQIAALRSQHERVPLILGSATPSLDTLLNVKRQRFQQLRLTSRHENRPLPTWQVEAPSVEPNSQPLSDLSLDAIEGALAQGDQALVFLNRRGFAPVYECQHCRWVATCPNCSCRLTAHRLHHQLLCHQCGHSRPIPSQCDQCRSQRLQMLGAGTEKLESFLQNRFAPWPVLRIDRDSTSQRGKRKQLLQRAARGEPGILVGTQMLAKGHHFPRVTLAVILGVDQGLMSADPWAMEQTTQLCIQVAGRAGRGDRAGSAILETTLPDHPIIRQLVTRDYEIVAQQLLEQRKSGQLPPYGYWALIRAEHRDDLVCEQLLSQVVENLLPGQTGHTALLGPVPCMLERRGNRFRYQLQLCSMQRSALHELADRAVDEMGRLAGNLRVRWSVDIDPLGLD